jgi:hypothetical protein
MRTKWLLKRFSNRYTVDVSGKSLQITFEPFSDGLALALSSSS